jgi:hypothetical protein
VTATLGLAPLVQTGFSLAPNLSDSALVIKFAGNGDMAAVAALAAYLKLVHKEAMRLQAHEVCFDIRELYFMNSSCFKSFVSWIDIVARLEPEGYRIKFLANPQQHWQRRSLEALRRMADRVVSIET